MIRKPLYRHVTPQTAKELSSLAGLADWRFWRYTKVENPNVREYSVCEKDGFLEFGFVGSADGEFHRIGWVTNGELRQAESLSNSLISSDTSAARPPCNAEFVFYLFLDAKNCDALVGDLEERYRLIHTKFGKRKADFWYWTQALRSVGPIVWAWAKRVALKPVLGILAWAVGKNLIGQDSLWGLLVDLWRKIRL